MTSSARVFCERHPAEVDHHGDVGQRARLDGPIDGGEIRAHVVGRLDADDHPFVLQRHFRRRPGLHVGKLALKTLAAHPVADDVEEREDTSPGASDDGLAEDREITPAGRAGVGHGGDAAAQRHVVGIHAALAGIGIAFAGAGEDVHVDIDESGSDVKTLHVDGLVGRRRVDAGGHGRDLAVADGDIADLVDLVLGIDDVASLQQEVILLPGMRAGREQTAR